jgi:hypothetical protein
VTSSSWARVSGAMGIPFVIAYVLILALTGDSPSDSSSDKKIMDYYGSHSHRVRDITVIFIALAALALFLWFLGHLRTLLSSAEAGGARGAALAGASGTAFAALFAVAGCAFTAPSFVIADGGSKFTLDPNTFRLLSGIGVLAYIAAFILGAPLAFAVGVVGWRTRILPRWLAVASFLAGIGALAGFAFVPTWVDILWILILSVYLAFRPWGRTTPAAAAGVG